MTASLPRLGAAALVLAAAAVLTTACSATPEPAESASGAPTTPAPVETTAAPVTEPTAGPIAAPACDELVSESAVSTYEEYGWTSQQDVFRVGSLELDDGVICRWADFTTASDQIQMFGWAPITESDAASARDELLDSGWIEIEGTASSSVLITENPDYAISLDEEGYGQTYEFGDGWVTFADTKQSLLMIERPQG